MSNVIHFNSPEERMRFLKGKFEEIIPVEVEMTEKNVEEKPKKAKKSAKKSKKEAKNDEIQAE